MNSSKCTNFFIVLFIVSLAVAPSFALGEGNRNLLLIGVMGLSPVLLIIYRGFFKTDVLLILLMFSLILAPLLNHPETMRWSTVLYSCMFCLTFMAFVRLITSGSFSSLNFIRLIRNLILAYTTVLIIQQICVLFGLPIFNLSNYDPSTPWKLNSLSAEPSHSARIIALLMYSFISLKEIFSKTNYRLKINFRRDQTIWICFFYSMLTMGSAAAILFVLLILLKTLEIKRINSSLFFAAILLIIISNSELTSVNRTFDTIRATITLDESKILNADHSAAMRILPVIVTAKKIGLTEYDDWLGHGVDYTNTFISQSIPGSTEGAGGGGTFQLWIEYGFITFVIFILFTIKLVQKTKDKINFIFWLLLVFIVGINNQVVWLFLITIYSINFYKNQYNGNT